MQAFRLSTKKQGRVCIATRCVTIQILTNCKKVHACVCRPLWRFDAAFCITCLMVCHFAQYSRCFRVHDNHCVRCGDQRKRKKAKRQSEGWPYVKFIFRRRIPATEHVLCLSREHSCVHKHKYAEDQCWPSCRCWTKVCLLDALGFGLGSGGTR